MRSIRPAEQALAEHVAQGGDRLAATVQSVIGNHCGLHVYQPGYPYPCDGTNLAANCPDLSSISVTWGAPKWVGKSLVPVSAQ